MIRFQVEFQCDRRGGCDVSERHLTEMGIEGFQEYDTFGPGSVDYTLIPSSLPEGWTRETRYGTLYTYCPRHPNGL